MSRATGQRAGRHARPLAGAVAALLLTVAGCDRLLVEPAGAPEGIAISLSVEGGPLGQVVPEIRNADHVRVQVVDGALILVDTAFSLPPGATDLLVPVLFTGQQSRGTLRVELSQGFLPLLRGLAEVEMRQRRVTEVQVPLSPVTAVPLSPAAQMSAGLYHSCAVTEAGRVYCWGLNEVGQLGDGTTGSAPLPVSLSGALPAFRSVKASYAGSCALSTAGQAFCWGSNERGSLGLGGVASSPFASPVGGALRFQTISVGGLHACGLTADGSAYCWGFNRFGQLGTGTTTDTPQPVAVSGGNRFRSLSAGYLHTCAVDTQDRPHCWGLNDFGQLGIGSQVDRNVPTPVGNLGAVRQVSAGGLHTCALSAAGSQLLCWGYNGFGQLGLGDAVDRAAPAAVAGVQLNQVSAGGMHSCGVAGDGRALCWGYNRSGAVGDGGFSDRAVPTPVADLPAARSVAAGLHHSCGIAADGRALCWGYNRFGQVGDGSLQDRSRPSGVLSVESFFASGPVAAGELRDFLDRLLEGIVRP
jgi:alpha-tubulin suppressor-like RCC1 family protein